MQLEDITPESVRQSVAALKYSEDQPRDERGRFGEGDGGVATKPPKTPEQERAAEIQKQIRTALPRCRVTVEPGAKVTPRQAEAIVRGAQKVVRDYPNVARDVKSLVFLANKIPGAAATCGISRGGATISFCPIGQTLHYSMGGPIDPERLDRQVETHMVHEMFHAVSAHAAVENNPNAGLIAGRSDNSLFDDYHMTRLRTGGEWHLHEEEYSDHAQRVADRTASPPRPSSYAYKNQAEYVAETMTALIFAKADRLPHDVDQLEYGLKTNTQHELDWSRSWVTAKDTS